MSLRNCSVRGITMGKAIKTTRSGETEAGAMRKKIGSNKQLFFTKIGAFLKPNKAIIQKRLKAVKTEFIL